MSALPRVLVIIVTWNKKFFVVDLLNSLKKLSYPEDRFDVLVVDNASSDGTAEILNNDFPNVHVIRNSENLGGTGGFNTGLQYAFRQPDGKYDYLWLLDNDVQVNRHALAELIALLEEEQDAAIAGSTMMQLTTPWRINEMGSFVELGRGGLLLNRYQEDVSALKRWSLQELLEKDIDLSDYLQHCRSSMDVEYVAAASLVIRSDVAKKAGIWDDYFIHYDDVEWCLRIARMGYRIMVSARSLIWHLPAEYKVPTWVLYYDNRNVLYMLGKHAGNRVIKGAQGWIRKKSLYYTLLGKKDLARLHLEAIKDFEQKKTGKKDIVLDDCYYSLSDVAEILENEKVQRVLIPWTVDLQACNIQKILVKVMKKHPHLHVDYLVPPSFLQDALPRQLPGAGSVHVPSGKIRRLYAYFRLRGQYDLVLQSDYQPILPLVMTAKRILFVNYEGMSLRQRPTFKSIIKALKSIRTPI
jgi:GT2 family glycosyltransferase